MSYKTTKKLGLFVKDCYHIQYRLSGKHYDRLHLTDCRDTIAKQGGMVLLFKKSDFVKVNLKRRVVLVGRCGEILDPYSIYSRFDYVFYSHKRKEFLFENDLKTQKRFKFPYWNLKKCNYICKIKRKTIKEF